MIMIELYVLMNVLVKFIIKINFNVNKMIQDVRLKIKIIKINVLLVMMIINSLNQLIKHPLIVL